MSTQRVARGIAACLTSVMLLAAANAKATPVTFAFTGIIDRIDGWGDLGVLVVPPGTTFSGYYTFESTAPGYYPDSVLGIYGYWSVAPDGMTVQFLVGSNSFETPTGFPVSWIGVSNDYYDEYTLDTLDGYGIESIGVASAVPQSYAYFLFEVRCSPDLYRSSALPSVPPPLEQCTKMNKVEYFSVAWRDGSTAGLFQFDGHLTALTRVAPVPPQEAVQGLVSRVLSTNIKAGLSNSLDAKLQCAMSALDDLNTHNNAAAVNSLQAFQNAVEAQRGQAITDAVATDLISRAQAVIDTLASWS